MASQIDHRVSSYPSNWFGRFPVCGEKTTIYFKMGIEIEVDKAYSHKELLEDYGLKMMRFHSGFSLFIDENYKIYHFNHHLPPEDKPYNRFYFQVEIRKTYK